MMEEKLKSVNLLNNTEDKLKAMLGIVGLSVDPYEVAAFMPVENKFKEGWWKMRFILKSGSTIDCEFMNETCFRSWCSKLQCMFDYIHPGKIEEWKVKHGFTGYLDMDGGRGKSPKLLKAEKEFEEKKGKQLDFKKIFKK